MASVLSYLGYGGGTTPVEEQSSALTLAPGSPQEVVGTFNIGGTVRIAQPWRGKVGAGTTHMTLEIISGNARFGRLDQVSGTFENGGFDKLGTKLVLDQTGDSSGPARWYTLVSEGTRPTTHTMNADRSISTQPGVRSGAEVTVRMQINDQEPVTHTFNTMTKPGEEGTRAERVRNLRIGPYMDKGVPTVVIQDYVDTSCMDFTRDAAAGCGSVIGAGTRGLGSVVWTVGSRTTSAVKTGPWSIAHPLSALQSVRASTAQALQGTADFINVPSGTTAAAATDAVAAGDKPADTKKDA